MIMSSKEVNVREYRMGNQNEQSRETGNIGYSRRRKTKQKKQHNMCWTPLYANKDKLPIIRTRCDTIYIASDKVCLDLQLEAVVLKQASTDKSNTSI